MLAMAGLKWVSEYWARIACILVLISCWRMIRTRSKVWVGSVTTEFWHLVIAICNVRVTSSLNPQQKRKRKVYLTGRCGQGLVNCRAFDGFKYLQPLIERHFYSDVWERSVIHFLSVQQLHVMFKCRKRQQTGIGTCFLLTQILIG